MTTYTVVKPFKSFTRRFKVGDVVTDAEIDGAITVDDWIRLGCLTEAPPEPVVIAPADEPETLESGLE